MLEVNRRKLRELEQFYDDARRGPGPLTEVRRLSLQSIKRMINQLTEEIVRYEARSGARP